MEYEDLRKIDEYTQRFPDIETGGDLFGSWASTNDGSAFVDFAIGPGRNVRRTHVAFFQDSEYLATAGNLLVDEYQLAQVSPERPRGCD